jgi:putative ABC transport system permease protein
VRFSSLIIKNVLHRPVRTVLTTLGLAIAIAAVTILVGISWNFEGSFLALYNSKKIDLVVDRAGNANQLSSSLDEKMADRLRQIEGVAEVAPSLVDTLAFEEHNLVSVLVDGWIPGSILFRGIKILDGRPLQSGDDKAVILGRVLAMTLDKKAGDRLQVSGEPFEVVGIFESESWFENGSLTLPLKTLQKMMTHVISVSCAGESRRPFREWSPPPRAITCRATPRSGLPAPWPGQPRRSPSF